MQLTQRTWMGSLEGDDVFDLLADVNLGPGLLAQPFGEGRHDYVKIVSRQKVMIT